jgi:TRAP-type C4-dicarboxylate transport system permease small subunit
MKAVLEKMRDVFQVFTSAIAVILAAVLIIINFIGIICRFVFNYPLSWTFELSILCFSWIIFLGMGLAFKQGEHMSLTLIVGKLTGKLRYVWKQGICLICIVFLVIALVEGLRVMGATLAQTYNTIPVSKGLFYLALPIGSINGILSIICTMLDLKVVAKNSITASGGN